MFEYFLISMIELFLIILIIKQFLIINNVVRYAESSHVRK